MAFDIPQALFLPPAVMGASRSSHLERLLTKIR